MSSVREQLRGLRLLEPAAAFGPPVETEGHPRGELLRLCHRGELRGGLSVALDVRADELIGPLSAAMGGSARKLRVLDVRDRPEPELAIQLGQTTERWTLPEGLRSLIHNLNDLFRGDGSVRAVAVLGEWEDMLQLWCVEKGTLPRLWRTSFFDPENRGDLGADPG